MRLPFDGYPRSVNPALRNAQAGLALGKPLAARRIIALKPSHIGLCLPLASGNQRIKGARDEILVPGHLRSPWFCR